MRSSGLSNKIDGEPTHIREKEKAMNIFIAFRV
jgi:hypothetical protein